VFSATDSRRALIGTIAIHFDTLILSITNEMFTGAASQERIAGIFSVTRNSDTSRIVGITFRVLFASDGDGTLIGPLTSYGNAAILIITDKMSLAIVIVRTLIRAISCLTDTDLILTDKVRTNAAIQTRFTLMRAGTGQYLTGKIFASTFRV
jgi:hypothetical protein